MDISTRLEIHKRSEVPHLIGMKSSIRTITSFLKDGSPHTIKILTIWGMAGIGKTYLANYIFKLHHMDFERSSLLEDIDRRCKQPGALLDLQKQLLKDIRATTWMDIDNIGVATSKIEKLLTRKKMFLVLDGIDDFEQLNVLIGKTSFHPGSRVIITTKDASLTEKCRLFDMEVPPNHTKHLLEGLNQQESLKLLSWHAFMGNDPKESYEKLARKVVEYCGGNPLALVVLGSSLRKQDVVEWEDTIELLQKESTPTIRQVLQVSFDLLPYENDKELFKHIACFFIGEDREVTEAILRGCDLSSKSGFSRLIDRCLLTIRGDNKLMMHQLLQEMGRYLVHQESPEKPWKRSRLWHHEETYNVLKQEKGTAKIQGLVFDMKMIDNGAAHGTSSYTKEKFGDDRYNEFGAFPFLRHVYDILSKIWCLFVWVFFLGSSYSHKHAIKTNAFSKMDKLRLLQLHYVQLHGSYEHFPKGLTWLSMHGFPLSYIPSKLQMENMVALDMSYSNIQRLWKKPKMLGSLKFLILRYCHELVSVGHFDGFPLLERLILGGCVSLAELCESIGCCDRLLVLDVSGCAQLKRLPRSIGKLKNLATLSINGCSSLVEFPKELKDLVSLEVVEADGINIESRVSSCVIIEGISRSLKSFANYLPSSIVRLSLTNNNLFDESFPLDFGGLPMLKELNLDQNPISSLPNCVRSLSRLEFLSLEQCHRLKTVLCAPSTLKSLHIGSCDSLEKITFHPEMSTLPIVQCLALGLLPIESAFKMQVIHDEVKACSLADVDEEIACSLGWINIWQHVKDQKAIADVDEEIACSLGWINIWQHVKDQKLAMTRTYQLYVDKRSRVVLPVQMWYEHGTFYTFYHGKQLPDWITLGSSLPLMNFTLRSPGRRIRGLNVCIVTSTVSSNNLVSPLIILRNSTKRWTKFRRPRWCVIPESDEESIVCLSHWTLRSNEFEDGDEASVHAIAVGGDIKEFGISIAYDDGNEKEDP